MNLFFLNLRSDVGGVDLHLKLKHVPLVTAQ